MAILRVRIAHLPTRLQSHHAQERHLGVEDSPQTLAGDKRPGRRGIGVNV
jgi:hypothetical protein